MISDLNPRVHTPHAVFMFSISQISSDHSQIVLISLRIMYIIIFMYVPSYCVIFHMLIIYWLHVGHSVHPHQEELMECSRPYHRQTLHATSRERSPTWRTFSSSAPRRADGEQQVVSQSKLCMLLQGRDPQHDGHWVHPRQEELMECSRPYRRQTLHATSRERSSTWRTFSSSAPSLGSWPFPRNLNVTPKTHQCPLGEQYVCEVPSPCVYQPPQSQYCQAQFVAPRQQRSAAHTVSSDVVTTLPLGSIGPRSTPSPIVASSPLSVAGACNDISLALAKSSRILNSSDISFGCISMSEFQGCGETDTANYDDAV